MQQLHSTPSHREARLDFSKRRVAYMFKLIDFLKLFSNPSGCMSNAGFLFLSVVTFSKTVLCFSLFLNWCHLRLPLSGLLNPGHGNSNLNQKTHSVVFECEIFHLKVNHSYSDWKLKLENKIISPKEGKCKNHSVICSFSVQHSIAFNRTERYFSPKALVYTRTYTTCWMLSRP